MRQLALIMALTFPMAGCRIGNAPDAPGAAPGSHSGMEIKAVQVLKDCLRSERDWVRVHSGEFLAQSGHKTEPAAVFGVERATREKESPYRIGIWRVLAQADATPSGRQHWTNCLENAFLDLRAEDRGHAAESLGKLGFVPQGQIQNALRSAAISQNTELQVLACWVLANGDPAFVERLSQYLSHAEPRIRGMAAYALRHQSKLSKKDMDQFAKAAALEEVSSPARIYLVTGSYVHLPGASTLTMQPSVLTYLKSQTPKERYEACAALAVRGGPDVLHAVEPLLEDPDADVRASAANALLRILERSPTGPRAK